MKENYYLNRKIQSLVTNNYTDYEKLPLLTLPKNPKENYLSEQNADIDKDKDFANRKKRTLK